MKISIDELKGLPQHRLTFDFNETLAQLNAVKPVLGELTVGYSASSIRLSGQVKTLLKLHCDRCLRPYFQSLNVEIDERFVPQSFLPDDRDNEVRELHGKDFVEPLPDNGILDITDVVYQAVTLATPSYCLCGDECPGPSAAKTDGENDAGVSGSGPGGQKKVTQAPIDPRWKNLKTLFPNEDSPQNS